VKASVALADGTPRPYDETLQEKSWRETERLQEARFNERRAKYAAAYADYRQTKTWRAKRTQVLARDKGVCQGCLSREATQVHHLTYEHIGAELLFELISLCDECHERVRAGSTSLSPIDEEPCGDD
jgi:5-methylcytosine-specific restriction endonuclease McrA